LLACIQNKKPHVLKIKALKLIKLHFYLSPPSAMDAHSRQAAPLPRIDAFKKESQIREKSEGHLIQCIYMTRFIHLSIPTYVPYGASHTSPAFAWPYQPLQRRASRPPVCPRGAVSPFLANGRLAGQRGGCWRST
jgi:hypothetical protein